MSIRGPSCEGVNMSEDDKAGPSQAKEERIKTVVNLFAEPHNRMKELVSWPLTEAARLSDVHDLEPSLQAIYEAMWEMKTHEYIENHYIMDRLKARLQSRRVYNELVCNCHEDSKLLEVIGMVEKVYSAQTQRERCKYGRRLQKSIRSFLNDFLHHMDEEEAVFQPLLVENFEPKELADMNETVLKQHSIFREKVKTEKSLKALKRRRQDEVFDEFDFSLEDLRFRKTYCQEVSDHVKKQMEEEEESKKKMMKMMKMKMKCIDDLPEEVTIMVLSHLSPRDLLACAAVSRRWRRIAYSSVFWQALYPTQWARGQWSFDYIPPELKEAADDDYSNTLLLTRSSSSSLVSLASSTESLDSTHSNSNSNNEEDDLRSSKENNRIFDGIIAHLLPKIGLCVSTIILSANKRLTSRHVKEMLKQVPNVRRLNLSHTNVTSEAFEGLNKAAALRKLEELNLAGCVRVSDNLLHYLSRCYFGKRRSYRSKLRKLNLSGCRSITSAAIECLEVHHATLQELDLSGCYKVDGETLTLFARQCRRLRPERLAYCNDIEDGPYPESANGCLNLECEVRFCCQKLRN